MNCLGGDDERITTAEDAILKFTNEKLRQAQIERNIRHDTVNISWSTSGKSVVIGIELFVYTDCRATARARDAQSLMIR